MATLQLLALFIAALSANAHPQQPELPMSRNGVVNTIFGDDKLKGEAFEEIDRFSNVTFYNDVTNPYRLPEDTYPQHYDIFWNIDMTTRSYSGIVDIEILASRPGVNEIVLHSDHHDVNSVELRLKGNNNTIPITYRLDTPYDFLRVRPNSDLLYDFNNPVVYTLSISFEAKMRTDMYGIYESWFKNNYNEPARWMATTQFQATAARSAFPCYDEPKFKATFAITIRRPTTYRSWSCMKIRTTANLVANYQDDIYHVTPIMSTYLLALIVAEYGDITNESNTYEVIARPAAIESGQGVYAFNVGQDLLAEMSRHTDIDFYSVNENLKMTQASIPDFGAGAMENWGLLTYREAYLMYDENHTNKYFKQLIAYILSHEITHMWFGNLVTNDWWDVLWLNEGYARYYQYFLTHWVEVDMGFETRFIVEQVHTSLLTDSSNNPQPLTNPGVGSPAAVSAMFSTISYNKGAAIIRQTEHLLGFEVQRLGLRNYLRNKQFKAALPSDLFSELQAAGDSQNALSQYGPDFSIAEYYKSWTEQPGHPVLFVNVNHQTGDMTITQRRFNINTGYGNNNLNYIVPISFATASNPDFDNTKPTHILKDSVAVINRGSTGDEWVIFNKQQTGYYRINYDDYTWNLIVLALRGPDRLKIHEYNRAQIVNDVFQYARSGIMTYNRAFNILSFLEFETEYAPWVAAVTGFNWIRNRLQGTPQLVQLEQMITRWATNVITELGYNEPANESFMRSYLRYQLAPLMCNMQHQPCLDAAKTLFTNLIQNNIQVPVDSRNWVYCNGLRQGSVQDFNVMYQRFLQHQVYTEKILLLQTLGCTPHAESLTTFMNSIVKENEEVRPQDYTTARNTAVSGNEGNTQIAFNYVKDNLPDVINAFGSASSPLSYISSRLRTEALIMEFQNWATQNQAALGTSYNSVFNGAENSRESIRWAAAVAADINEYLVNGNENLATTSSTLPPTTQVVTTERPTLPEIVNPEFPDSAVTSFLSMTVVVIAFIVTIAF